MLFPTFPPRRNGFAYLFWRWALKKDGKFTSWLEKYFFGPSHGLNDYDALAHYKKSHAKPDKQYSILPTVLSITGDIKNKVVMDLGCGTGFFTLPLAEKADLLYGVDNSVEQLALASPHRRILYLQKDIFIDELPCTDCITAPFVVNYAKTVPALRFLLHKLYCSLNPNGRLVMVVDLPDNKEHQRFGASKKILGTMTDESPLQIDIFNGEEKICTLDAIYFTPSTIEKTLRLVGFKTICWHKPLISQEGIDALGLPFWDGYLENPELGYITATK